MNIKSSFIGTVIAFLLATACCWLPVLALSFGGAAALIGLSGTLESLSPLFMTIGLFFLGIGVYRIYQSNTKNMPTQEILTNSIITCPECGHKAKEEMPTNACQYFYECLKCKNVLKPLTGDCCVYCSYGSVPCPPIQSNQGCC